MKIPNFPIVIVAAVLPVSTPCPAAHSYQADFFIIYKVVEQTYRITSAPTQAMSTSGSLPSAARICSLLPCL